MTAIQSLEALAVLEPGWLDGDGEAISIHAIEQSRRVILSAESMGVETKAVFPMEDGGVRLLFNDNVTIDVSPFGNLYSHKPDLANGTYQETTFMAEAI